MKELEIIVPQEIKTAVLKAAGESVPVYLVGGAVRDLLLGLEPHDIDFCLESNVKTAARKIANELAAAVYTLDEPRSSYRVIYTPPAGKRITIDLAGLRGTDLASDLKARDFTINAMAIHPGTNRLIDPTGGAADLKNRILRMTSSAAFSDDPLRVLRGLRLAAQFNLRIEDNTLAAMKSSLSAISGASAERQRDEIFRMFELPRPSTAIRALELVGGLPVLFPELLPTREFPQTKPHYQDVWNHTLAVMDQLSLLLRLLAGRDASWPGANLVAAAASMRLGRFRQQLRSHFNQEISSGRTLSELMMLAVLYHDAGKPDTASLGEDGRIYNYGHEEISAGMAAKRAQAMQLSRSETQRLEKIIRHHMRLHSLVASRMPPSRRAIYRYFRDTGEAGVDICLLTLADTLGTYAATMPQETWFAYLDVCRVMMEAWWENNSENVAPALLLNGNDLQTIFQIEPGPDIGKTLEALREGQAGGTIRTREEAIQFVQGLLGKNDRD